jgi:hypothetical protein
MNPVPKFRPKLVRSEIAVPVIVPKMAAVAIALATALAAFAPIVVTPVSIIW